MNKNILQKLYDGKIYPSENIGKNNPEFEEISDRLDDEKINFIKNLSDTDREGFHKVDNLQNESNAVYAYESFVHGFKLGVSLIHEGLSDANFPMKKYLRNIYEHENTAP